MESGRMREMALDNCYISRDNTEATEGTRYQSILFAPFARLHIFQFFFEFIDGNRRGNKSQ